MKQPVILLLRLLGLILLGLCFLVLLNGGPVDKGFLKVGNVKPRLFIAAFCLFVAYLLPTEGRHPRKLRLANVCLMLFSLSVCVVGVELTLRAYLQKTQGFNSIQQLHNPNPDGNLNTRSHHPLLVITQLSSDKRLIFEMQPNVDMMFGHKKLLTNLKGFRADREYSPEKAPGIQRILGVGDSGMWGWGLDQNQGYMEILEQELNTGRESPRAEVMNLAVPGYNTFQELMALRLKGLDYKPDIVVIGWCENDFQLPFFMYTRKNHWKQKGSYVFSLLFDRETFMEMVSPEVLKKDDIPKDTVDPDVIAHSGEDGVRKTLDEFRQLAEEEDFHVVLFGPLNEDIRNLCDSAGIRYINSYDLMETNPPDDCAVFYMHPRPCGHEILGRFLAQRLHEFGWLE